MFASDPNIHRTEVKIINKKTKQTQTFVKNNENEEEE